jgi:murein DD-endopeptidase MepM/ murein hydrolase activator NlpD
MKLLYASMVVIMMICGASVYPIPVRCNGLPHLPTIPARISQPFGHLGHVGIDYDVPVGTEVYAMMDGVVMFSREDSRVYGRSIYILGCDGYGFLYAHLSQLKVKFGEIVKSGQVIGLSGGDPNDAIDGDGWSSGAHLHFEIRVPGHLESNLYNIDPLIYWECVNKVDCLPRMQ